MTQQWWDRFERFLATDPSDIGCDEAMEVLHEYVELLSQGTDAGARFPGMAVHLAACGPCREDMRGLLSVVEAADAEASDQH